jgi:Cu-Zn family superoxide dismutase
MFPTTAARAGKRLLVVNSQFDKRGGTPVLPFTVAAVRRP